MPQPTDMKNDTGVILTVGMSVGIDRCAIVLPLCTNGTVDKHTMCQDVVTGFFTSVLNLLLDCISEEAFVTYLAAEGMTDGTIPHRADYPLTDHPGTRLGAPVPSQVAGLIVFYEDPDDSPPGDSLRVGKNFIPGLSKDDVSGSAITTEISGKLQLFADPLSAGFSEDANNWYRILATPGRTPATPVRRTFGSEVRGYICTQKRRLVPRS